MTFFWIYQEIEFQKVTFAYNFQIYKEVENLQNLPFEQLFKSFSSFPTLSKTRYFTPQRTLIDEQAYLRLFSVMMVIRPVG